MFYYLVLKNVFKYHTEGKTIRREIADQFRQIVKTTIWILIFTGVVLSVSQIAVQGVSLSYIGVLAVKIGLAVSMFLMYVANKKSILPLATVFKMNIYRTDLILVFGVLVIGLSDILSALS